MTVDGPPRGPRLDGGIRLVVVESPDLAAPLVGALDAADVGAWVWVEAERALYFSPRVLDLLGLDAKGDRPLLSRFLHAVPLDDRPRVRQLVETHFPAGPYVLRYRFAHADGLYHWIEDRGRVERDSHGALVRQGGALRDVTRDVEQEQARQEATARLEALINAIPFAVWGRSGPDLTVSHENQVAMSRWGDLRGTSLSDLPPDIARAWRPDVQKALSGDVVKTRHRYTFPDGVRIFDDIIAPVRVGGEITGVVGVEIDITDEERSRERMQEAQKLESLGVLAGGIAHDFNNLLTAILGNASLIRAELPAAADVQGPLEQIEIASRRAADLCRQMLAYAGRGRFQLQLASINDIVLESQSLLQVSVSKKASLELDLAANVPPVIADRQQIRQVLINLVINAAEAIGDREGTITIRTSATFATSEELSRAVFSPPLEAGRYVSVSVRDDGAGMTPEALSRIFDPFFTTKFTGRGLGLAAVIGIVRVHKGALRVESEPGAGSTFELLLPAQPAESDETADVSPAVADAAKLAAWRTTGTVLVADDEPGVRDLVRSVLQRMGLTVVVAEDGRSAVEAFRQIAAEARLALIDLTMPGLDGREALAAMRQIKPDLPAILMSGYAPAEVENTGPHVFLQKPFTPLTLRQAVYEALSGR